MLNINNIQHKVECSNAYCYALRISNSEGAERFCIVMISVASFIGVYSDTQHNGLNHNAEHKQQSA